MLQTCDEHAAGDPEEFGDKLSLFRFTLSPRERQLLDELLLQSMEPADSKQPEPVAAGCGHLAVPSVN